MDDVFEVVAGALVLQARQRAGMSQRQLAAAAGVAQPDISAYENGRTQPALPTLYRLIAAAGFDLRMRLEPADDHDATLRAWEATRPTAETEEWHRQQVAWTTAR